MLEIITDRHGLEVELKPLTTTMLGLLRSCGRIAAGSNRKLNGMKTVLACAGDLDALIDQLEPVIDDLLERYDELLVATAYANLATRDQEVDK